MVEWHSDTHGGGAWFNLKDHTTIQSPTFTEKQNIDSCIRSLNWKANLCHATGNLYTSGVSLEFFYLVFFFTDALCCRKILFQKKHSAAVRRGWSPWPFRAYTTETALNKQALKATLPTKVETPPRIHSWEDVQPSPLPHNTIYTASTAHRAPGPGQSWAITRQQEGRESTAQMPLPLLLCGLMTDNRPDVIDPGGPEKYMRSNSDLPSLRRFTENMKGSKNCSEKQDLYKHNGSQRKARLVQGWVCLIWWHLAVRSQTATCGYSHRSTAVCESHKQFYMFN